MTAMTASVRSTVREVVGNVRAEVKSPAMTVMIDGIAVEILEENFGIIIDAETIRRVMRDNR